MRESAVSSETSDSPGSSHETESRSEIQAAIVRAALNGPLQECDRLIREHPEARESFAVQIVLGDREGALAALTKDPTLARRPIGPKAREPVALLCFSLYQNDPGENAGGPADFVAILNRLLELGAPPDAYLSSGAADQSEREHGSPILFGCLGHAYNPLAAAALLKAGANPNDGESLYHAAERADGAGLRLLFENGAKLAGTNALKRKLDFDHFDSFQLLLSLAPDLPVTLEEKQEESGTAFTHAIRRMRDARYLDALLGAGARSDARFAGHSAFALAAVLGNQSAMDFLIDRKLETPLNPIECLLSAAARGDADAVRIQLQAHPDLPARLSPWDRLVHTELAKYDRRTAIVVLLESGLCEIDAPGESQMTALHQAAWFGYADLVAVLLEFEPDLRRENMFGGTALETAQYAAHHCRESRSGPADYERCVRLLKAAAKN